MNISKLQNEGKGSIWYGCHFYPGVARYQEPGKDAYTIFLNEETLRKMDPTFAGRPVFVEHVSDVDDNKDELRKEADGWVIESFYNEADGKHWVKFIAVTEKAERAIKNGFRLSNSYYPKKMASGGTWNGVDYDRAVVDGEYEHLALVDNPRYVESVIMSPDEFKKYNSDKLLEVEQISNSEKEKGKMKGLNFFKRSKVENADFESLGVVLPKSQKEMTIAQLVEEMDKVVNMHGYANLEHMVKMHDDSEMSVGDLLKEHKAMKDAMAEKEEKHDDDDMGEREEEKKQDDDEEESHKKREEQKVHDDDTADDEEAKKKALELAEHEDKEMEAEKKKNAKEKADKLRNANLKHLNDLRAEKPKVIEFSGDQVVRGQQRYGSSKK